MEPDLKILETTLGYKFTDQSLPLLALTHSSCQLETGDNQRLEFLGDAVVSLVVASALYEGFPDAKEGDLDRMRASLVNGYTLAELARELEIDRQLKVSDAHAQHRPEPSQSMLEDVIEALVGAVFQDGGYLAAEAVIMKIMQQKLAEVSDPAHSVNPKGKLQEWSQARHEGATPEYATRAENGPDHAKLYTVAVLIEGKEIARAQASSIKAAEVAAAREALSKTGA